jgi:hypothetical protein
MTISMHLQATDPDRRQRPRRCNDSDHREGAAFAPAAPM